MKIVNKSLVSIFFYAALFSILPIVQATFKTNWYGKSVYISSSSSKFLKTIVPEFEKWYYRQHISNNPVKGSLAHYRLEILNLLRTFRNSDKLEGHDIENLGKILHKAHDELILKLKESSFGEINRHLHKLIKEIGIDLSVAIRQVYVGTAEADLKVIDNYLRHPAKEYALTVYGLIQDIMKHFDGLAVTEYDFIVLSSSAFFVLLSVE